MLFVHRGVWGVGLTAAQPHREAIPHTTKEISPRMTASAPQTDFLTREPEGVCHSILGAAMGIHASIEQKLREYKGCDLDDNS